MSHGEAGEAVVLEDLGSTNGTLLNGEPIVSPLPLKDGDVISVGITRLVFHAPKN
ncbi:FHA domain-containing protein [Pseudomonas sp. 8(2025)]|uniref:FHA domain-containing protein n=1 Tax=Pseudomonas sp. 8(2025) TaxID=3456022 RepID=UPI004044A866